MRKSANLKTVAGVGALAGLGYLGFKKFKKRQARGLDLEVSLKPVSSSMIQGIGYDPKRKVMVVQFNTGKKYSYSDVPKFTYNNLLSAGSVGKGFNQLIRDKYTSEKVASAVERWREKKASKTRRLAKNPPNPKIKMPRAMPVNLPPTTAVTRPNTSIMSNAPVRNMQPPPPPPVNTIPKLAGIIGVPLMAGLAGAGVGGVMKKEDGTAGGMGGAVTGFMMAGGAALGAKNFLKAKVKPGTATPGQTPTATPGQTPAVSQPQTVAPPPQTSTVDPMVKQSNTVIASTLLGSGVGALTAGEGNRLRGAMLGAGAGLALGQVGRAIGGITPTGYTPEMMSKFNLQKSNLQSQLANVKGSGPRNEIVQNFLKNPNNTEFANVYRTKMKAQAGGALIGGVGAGLAVNNAITPKINPDKDTVKLSSRRAVDLFRRKHVKSS